MAYTIRSEKSTRSFVQCPNLEFGLFDDFDNIEEMVNFSEVIVFAVSKYGCPVSVAVHNILDTYQEIKPGKSKIRQKKVPMVKTLSSESLLTPTSKEPPPPPLHSTLVITASHDPNNRLVEISMNKYKYCIIPRIIMHILRHTLPKYTKLNKFKITDCSIDKHTIYELKHILTTTYITDVCLDSTFLKEGNYDILLEQPKSLKHLSLSRCKLNDEVCANIFSKLDFEKPAEKVLLTLNLSSNRITDAGAKSVGEVLKKNRHLRYLNLADNQITDDGATYILDAFKEFPLTTEEIIDKRLKYLRYLQNKRRVYERCLQGFDNTSPDKTRVENIKKSSKKKRAGSTQKSGKSMLNPSEFRYSKAELITIELLGPFEHPFDKYHVIKKDDISYCTGNLTLAYLNLAYNSLMYPSLKKLGAILECQQKYVTQTSCGLLKIVLVGNNLPEQCKESDSISEILSRRIRANKSASQVKITDKKSSAKSAKALK